MDKVDENKFVVRYAIPRELHSSLLEWGKDRGLDDETTIVGHMIANVLRQAE